MNELWYVKFKNILTQMNNVADKIQETVAKCDEATQILVNRKMFEYYDETTNICDGIPIHPEPITINLKEYASSIENILWDLETNETSGDGDKLTRFNVRLVYTFNAMDSPKFDEIIQFDIDIILGFDNVDNEDDPVIKSITVDFDKWDSDYVEQFLKKRYPSANNPTMVTNTLDDIRAFFKEIFSDERNATMFNNWVDSVEKTINEFTLEGVCL